MIDKLIPMWLKSRSQQTIWTITACLIVTCWLQSQKFDELFQTNTQLTAVLLGKVSITLILLSLALALSLFISLKRPNLKNYEIINPPGFMRHKKTGAYYCHPCLISKHIAVELSPISTKEMLCRLCKETYKIDYNVLICEAYFSKAHDAAVKALIHEKEKC